MKLAVKTLIFFSFFAGLMLSKPQNKAFATKLGCQLINPIPLGFPLSMAYHGQIKISALYPINPPINPGDYFIKPYNGSPIPVNSIEPDTSNPNKYSFIVNNATIEYEPGGKVIYLYKVSDMGQDCAFFIPFTQGTSTQCNLVRPNLPLIDQTGFSQYTFAIQDERITDASVLYEGELVVPGIPVNPKSTMLPGKAGCSANQVCFRTDDSGRFNLGSDLFRNYHLKITIKSTGVLLCDIAIPIIKPDTIDPRTGRGTISVRDICRNDATGECQACFNKRGTWTAFGCIPTEDSTATIVWFVSKAVFIVSGIAFLLMIFGAYQIMTASGDPKKVQAGSEVITSALSGLLFIILAVFLLKLIGVDILRLPGFGS